MKVIKYIVFTCAVFLTGIGLISVAKTGSDEAEEPAQGKPATDATIEANENVREQLNIPRYGGNYAADADFVDANHGFMERTENLIVCPDPAVLTDDKCILSGVGKVDPIWDLTEYGAFIKNNDLQDAPSTVNPSLWRNAKLNMKHGLYRVLKNEGTNSVGDIYQVRNYDLSNITFIYGEQGWVVFDPLISPETARAALELINEKVEPRQVSAVIFSHSHTDHYGGVNGLFYDAQGALLEDQKIAVSEVIIIAPEGFTEEAISENVTAGNAMGRRAVYMYGSLLARDARGSVNGGLGMTTSLGVPGLMLPTQTINEDSEKNDPKTSQPWSIDGIAMEFQMTPGTEAPAEMNTWLPEQNALWMAENTTNTMHNILTLRGAKVRDALLWAKYINETIDLYGDQAKVKFQSHHWPIWSKKNIRPYLEKQRDVYKFMHDQTVRLMNKGYNGEEISEMMVLPEALEKNWATRGYYGTLRHNSRAIYQYYMGWYNGNPSDLNNLPDLQASIRYVALMGGADKVVNKAKEAFDRGEYRWVAEVMKQVVFAYQASQWGYNKAGEPEHVYKYCSECTDSSVTDKDAKKLLADTLEQLGYQAESGPWRSEYLQGAAELRAIVDPSDDPKPDALQTATPDVIEKMSIDMLLDYLAIQVNAQSAHKINEKIRLEIADVPQTVVGEGSTDENNDDCNSSHFIYEISEGSNCLYDVSLNNSVLSYTSYISSAASQPTALVYMKKATLTRFATGEVAAGNITYTTEKDDVDTKDGDYIYIEDEHGGHIPRLLSLFDIPNTKEEKSNNFWFNIITPNEPFKLIDDAKKSQ